MGSDAVAIGFPLKLLQALRLAHAICETDLRVHVPSDEAAKFEHLATTFDIGFEVGTDGVSSIETIDIDHQRPSTGLGGVARPLILPRGMIERCSALWTDPRPINVSFCGLITPVRREMLERWTGATLENVHESGPDDGRMRLAFRMMKRRRLRSSTEVEVWSSRRGRSYPGKAWDDDYFALLGRSRFVLCPPGDFVWTYRFFEAVLCGAVPVVEESCDAYEGFTYHEMSQDPSSLNYDPDVVAANHRLAVERLTVASDELHDAVLRAAGR